MLVVIPAAGIGSRFSSYGFKTQKFLLPIDSENHSMLYEAIRSLNAPINSFYKLVIQREVYSEKLQDSVNEFNPSFTFLDGLTEGPACTVYEGLLKLTEEELEIPLLVSNSDQILENFNCLHYLKKSENFDGSVLTYTPKYDLKIGSTDKHSFVEFDNKGNCSKFAEKLVLSHSALVGVHYFKKAKNFVRAYKHMIDTNNRAPNGEFYISLVYQSMLVLGMSVRAIPLSLGEIFHPTGEPQDYFNYCNNVTKFGPKREEYFSVSTNLFSIEKSVIGKSYYSWININTRTGDIKKTGESYVHDTDDFMLLIHSFDLLQDQLAEVNGNIKNFTRGWLVGNFLPSIYKTDKFEVGFLRHKKDEKWDFHRHNHLVEYNHLISGKMIVNGLEFYTGDSFTFEKGHIAVPIFLEDCLVLCVKIPSIPNDKEIL